MKTEIVSERYVKKTAEEIREEIYPFKKLKKKDGPVNYQDRFHMHDYL